MTNEQRCGFDDLTGVIDRVPSGAMSVLLWVFNTEF